MGIYNDKDIWAFQLATELVHPYCLKDEDTIKEECIMQEDDFEEEKSYFCDRCKELIH